MNSSNTLTCKNFEETFRSQKSSENKQKETDQIFSDNLKEIIAYNDPELLRKTIDENSKDLAQEIKATLKKYLEINRQKISLLSTKVLLGTEKIKRANLLQTFCIASAPHAN